MLRNFFITAFRNLSRNRTYTFINVFGLALGISAALVLFKFINFHKSFDKHHSNYDELYRFVRHEISANRVDKDMGVPVPFAQAFANDYPDLGQVAVVQYANEAQLTTKNKLGNEQRFTEKGGIGFVTRDFFGLFDISLVAGNLSTALKNPGEVIISEALAARYFGQTGTGVSNVLGELITMDNKLELMVTGVMKDLPQNTDLPLTALASFASADAVFTLFDRQNWGSVSSNTNVYLLKNEGVAEEDIEAKLVDFVSKYMPDEIKTEEYYLQSLAEVHSQVEYDTHGIAPVSSQTLLGGGVIAIILILTACINFVNLATAQAVKRAKEVGVRKVLGGSKTQLTWQFLSETFTITFFAIIISLGIAELGLNRLDMLFDYNLTLDLMGDPAMLSYLVIIIVSVTLLAGLYPSFVLSSLNPVSAMKRTSSNQITGKFNLRRSLVITQFFISQFLIICTLVVIAQMRYLYTADMGFDREAIITFDVPVPSTQSEKLLRSRLESNPNIAALSFNVGAPMSGNNLGSNFNYEPLASETDFDAQFKVIDSHYLDLFGIELLAGRNFTASDTLLKNAIITETVMKMIGIQDPQQAVGITVNTGFARDKTIVGVVRDFHAHSLKSEITPLFLIGYPGYNYQGAIKVTGGKESLQSALQVLQTEWEAVYPAYTFESEVFEDHITKKYETEADQLTLFQVFSGIAIFIGCLGLYGLVAFMANQKTKEIGVRKVLGASVMQVLHIFSKELILLIGVAFVLAAPLGYYAMNQWLLDFKYNIDIEVWMFVIAIAFTMIIGGVTTGFRSVKAARANPVDSLRTE